MNTSTNRPHRSQRRFALRMLVLFLALGAVLAIVAARVQHTIDNLLEANEWVNHTHLVKEQIAATVGALRDAEAAQRAYIISGDAERLANAYEALPRVADGAARLGELVAENAQQAETAQRLAAVLAQRRDLIGKALAAERGAETPRLTPAQIATAKQQDAEVDVLAARMVELENRLLVQRKASTDALTWRTRFLSVGAVLLCFGLLMVALLLLLREQKRREESEERMAASNASLVRSLDESRRLGNTLHRLSDLGHLLQGCRSLDEAAAGLRAAMSGLFPSTAGTIHLMNASQNLLTPVSRWGEPFGDETVFAPDECWALRLGHVYPEEDLTAPFVCKHFGDTPPPAYLCIPLFAQGTALGTLQLVRAQPFDRETRNAAVAAGEQVSLAIANLQLQETLRTQSLRDALTGLFNRRYLEASLARDLARAIRNSQPLAVLMLDVDHFKRFNDQHGHEAGDALLAQFGELLATLSRSEDVVCRYGGEEFTIVLQEADAAIALDRAEDIRRNVESMRVLHRQEDLGRVTVSIGIASYPAHGDTPKQLLRRADGALYAAKHGGRNQVGVADRT